MQYTEYHFLQLLVSFFTIDYHCLIGFKENGKDFSSNVFILTKVGMLLIPFNLVAGY